MDAERDRRARGDIPERCSDAEGEEGRVSGGGGCRLWVGFRGEARGGGGGEGGGAVGVVVNQAYWVSPGGLVGFGGVG